MPGNAIRCRLPRWASSLAFLSLAACASPPVPKGAGLAVDVIREKLARVGIVPVSEEEAAVPPAERGRYIPCRAIPGFRNAALDPHPAGYLLVGVVGGVMDDAAATRRALEAWKPGSLLELKVRRNPYLETGPEWWERDVVMWLPEMPER